MRALFEVKKIFAAENKKSIIIEGEINNGEVHPNMYVQIPFNRTLSMEALICSVIEATNNSNSARLIIKCEEEGEIDLWLGLNIIDETILIISKKI